MRMRTREKNERARAGALETEENEHKIKFPEYKIAKLPKMMHSKKTADVQSSLFGFPIRRRRKKINERKIETRAETPKL
jgi:hypothetical protein